MTAANRVELIITVMTMIYFPTFVYFFLFAKLIKQLYNCAKHETKHRL